MKSETEEPLLSPPKGEDASQHATSTVKSPIIIIIDEEKKKISILSTLVWVHICFIIYVIGRAYYDKIIALSDAVVLLIAPILLSMYALWFMQVGRTKQLFMSPRILSRFPMLSLPLVPVAILMSVFAMRWSAVMIMVGNSASTLVALQATRALAVGTLIKWHRGVFPTSFGWGTGFPDMMFGLSAVTLLVYQVDLTSELVVAWNLIGCAIIAPFGITIVQLGMSPTQTYTSRVPLSVVFEHPMVLGPGIVVPILLCWNVLGALSAWED